MTLETQVNVLDKDGQGAHELACNDTFYTIIFYKFTSRFTY